MFTEEGTCDWCKKPSFVTRHDYVDGKYHHSCQPATTWRRSMFVCLTKAKCKCVSAWHNERANPVRINGTDFQKRLLGRFFDRL